MLEEHAAIKVEAPRYQDLRDLAQYILHRLTELEKERQVLIRTLKVISEAAGLRIDLNGNKIEESE